MKPHELESLNYKVKTIEMTLGVQLTENSVEGKRAFVERHWADRVKATDRMLQEAFEEAQR